MRVIIRGNWAPCVGTDYCEALGIYDSLEDAEPDAESRAWDTWEGQDDDEDDDYFSVEGPDYYVEEYILGEEGHDGYRAGGGCRQRSQPG